MGSHLHEDGRFPSRNYNDGRGAPLSEAHLFQAVASAELAFALTYFVAAGNSRVGSVKLASSEKEIASNRRCGQVFNLLCGGAEPPAARASEAVRGQSALAEAFWTLWQQYEGEKHQASLCARVLAFYLLMERSAGAVIETWVESSEDEPGLVALHPAVVEALSTVPLGVEGRLDEAVFVSTIESLANCDT